MLGGNKTLYSQLLIHFWVRETNHICTVKGKNETGKPVWLISLAWLHWFRIKLIARTREPSHVPPSLWRSNMVNKENRMWKHAQIICPLWVSVYLFHPCWLIYRVRGKSGNHHWVNDLSRQVLAYSLSQWWRVPPLWLTVSLMWRKILHYWNTTVLHVDKHITYMFITHVYTTLALTWCTSLNQWWSLWGRCGYTELS